MNRVRGLLAAWARVYGRLQAKAMDGVVEHRRTGTRQIKAKKTHTARSSSDFIYYSGTRDCFASRRQTRDDDVAVLGPSLY